MDLRPMALPRISVFQCSLLYVSIGDGGPRRHSAVLAQPAWRGWGLAANSHPLQHQLRYLPEMGSKLR